MALKNMQDRPTRLRWKWLPNHVAYWRTYSQYFN